MVTLCILENTVTFVQNGLSPKRLKIGFQDQLLLHARGTFCNTLTSIKVPFVFKIFVLSIFEWPFYTGFTVRSFKPQSGLNNSV